MSTSIIQLDPKRAAEAVFEAHKDERAWLDSFGEQLDRKRAAYTLERVLLIWDLSQADCARVFGVSRQAVGKWMAQGVPADRAEAIGNLAAATDLLVRYLKRDRIPAVARRPIAARGMSLLELLAQGQTAELLETCREMFAFENVHD